MITGLEVTKYFYKILNVAELNDLITGKVYRLHKDKNSELEDIEINVLNLSKGYPVIQNGVVNINCYVKNINGRSDIKRLDIISKKVLEVLQNYKQHNNNLYFEIVETFTFNDLQQNSLTVLNIKIEIHIK